MNESVPSEQGEQDLPIGYYAYSLLCISSALVVPTGTYRSLTNLLDSFGLPELIVSAVAGVLNLTWNEFAYLLGKPLKTVEIFVLLPLVASALNFITASLLLLRKKIGIRFAMGNLLFTFVIAVASLAVIIKRGDDSWRLVSTVAVIFVSTGWLIFFRKRVG